MDGGLILKRAYVAAFFLFIFFPLGVTVLISLDPRDYVFGLPPSISFRWYQSFIENDTFVNGLTTSLIVASISMIISTSVGIFASYSITRSGKGFMKNLGTYFLSPLLVPTLVTGIALLMYLKQLGMLNSLINLVVGHTVITLPYSVRVLTAVFSTLDPSIEEAAMSLGASPLKVFSKIVLPMIRPGLMAATIFTFSESLNDYAVSIFLSDSNSYTFSVALFSYLKAVFDPSIAVASVLLMAITVVLIYAIEKTFGLDKVVGMW